MSKVIDLYLLTALSNLHVGRGDSNYGIVDNEVQRDPITDYPTIFASSLKGALRESTSKKLGSDQETIVFGTSVRETRADGENAPKSLQQGEYNFHQAYLLSLPVRGDKVPFYHATTPDLLKELEDQLKMLLPEAKPLITALEGANQMQLGERPLLPSAGAVDEYEGAAYQEVDKRQVEKWINADLIEAPVAVFGAPQFRSVCERLPVLARNQLEQGISKNLFYEEIVPRRARFFFFIERPAACDYLHEALQQLGQRVQVGANATVGYGMCKIERIYTTQKNN